VVTATAALPTRAAPLASRQAEAARGELGALLSKWREHAGFRQEDLARRTHYGRTTIAWIEAGRQSTPRAFWQRADAALGAGGVLVAGFEQLEELVDEARRVARRRARYATLLAELRRYADLGSGGCPYGCHHPAVRVPQWTGRHVRALREAARLTAAELAGQLGVPTGVVTGWQRRTTPLPAAVQQALDDWLSHADPAVPTRLHSLLDSHRD
jgi:transcriptional regulator with XRE-family HTH domain